MKQACTIGQGFGGNATATYKAGGLLGHPAIDNYCGYGSKIFAYHNEAYVYKVLTKENPSNDGSGFTGVFVIVDNGIEIFEFLYGHCDPLVKVGDIIRKGDLIGTEANNGEVYAGSGTKDSDFVRITLEMQKAGDHRGAHRHDQKRILRKDLVMSNERYLTGPDGAPFYYQNKYWLAVPFYTNGYNGCVNWLLPLFNRNLCVGMSGYDVNCLQNFLRMHGFFKGDTTDYFGSKTLSAVISFQKANGLTPSVGFVGPATRSLINSIVG